MPSPAAIDAASTGDRRPRRAGGPDERPRAARAETGRGRHQDHPRRAGHRWRLGHRGGAASVIGSGLGRGPGRLEASSGYMSPPFVPRARSFVRGSSAPGSPVAGRPGSTRPAAGRGVIHTAPAQGHPHGDFADGVAVAALNPDGVDDQYAARPTVGHLPWTSINASHCSCSTRVVADATNQRRERNSRNRGVIRCGTSPCTKKPWRGHNVLHGRGRVGRFY